MLLPSSSAPIMRSLSSVTAIAAAAPVDPLSACALSLLREAAVSAVSEPEKKADITSSPRMTATVSQKAVSRVEASMMLPCIDPGYAKKRAVPQPLRVSGRAVMLHHQGGQSLVKDMRVDLGGRQVGMAQQRLDHPKVGPPSSRWWQRHGAGYAASPARGRVRRPAPAS